MNPDLDFDKLNSSDPKIKYGFTKQLLSISKINPEYLYDYFDKFENMLKSDNNIIKWTAIGIIGYLSSVNNENKTVRKIPDLIKFLHCGNLITCNHAIFSLGLIAQNKPDYKKKIINELLTISKDKFETEECKRIAAGKVVETYNKFIDDIINNKPAIDFIKKAVKSKRNATKKKAEKLLTKIYKKL